MMCVFLFSKAISCFSEAGTEATECQSAADCKSNQVLSLQQIVMKFFLEICFKTRPSILCVTHQMSPKKRNYSVG